MYGVQQIRRMAAHAILLIGLFGLANIAGAADGARIPDGREPGPPFRVGEVAVYATPEELPGQQVLKFLPHAGISVVAVEPGREMAQAQRMRAQGRRAGLNHVAHAFSTVNDPYYSPYQWHLTHIQSEAAWGLNAAGATVTVAVLDTGLKPGGPDGIGCVTSETDIVNRDANAYDGDGHGTHVSGTIAQTTDNGVAVAGMAHDACVMPVKVLDDSGSGSFADIADGVYYAVANGAEVINMSLGIAAHWGITYDDVLGPALDYAYSNGVTVVCAAGNDGFNQNVSYPGSHPYTIAVGATDFDNQVTQYSNKGAGLDIVAPGGNTSVDANADGYVDGVLQETDIGAGWGYYFFQGTSMASPHVAAVAAMLISHGTATTPDEVYQALTATALDLGGPGFDSTYGHGLVQAYAALQSTPGGGNLAPTASFTYSCTGLACDFDAGGSDDSDGSIVSYDWDFGDGQMGFGSQGSHIYQAGGTYSVTLTVVDDTGASGSDTQPVSVDAPIALEAPSGVFGTDVGNGTAHVSWTDNGGAKAGFQVERQQQNKRGKWTGVANVAAVGAETTFIVDPSGAGTFRYRVAAYSDSDIAWSNWSGTVTVTDGGAGGGGAPSKGYCKKNPTDPACP